MSRNITSSPFEIEESVSVPSATAKTPDPALKLNYACRDCAVNEINVLPDHISERCELHDETLEAYQSIHLCLCQSASVEKEMCLLYGAPHSRML